MSSFTIHGVHSVDKSIDALLELLDRELMINKEWARIHLEYNRSGKPNV